LEEVVRHCRVCFFGGFHFVCYWVLQILAHEFVDSAIECRREQQTLTIARCVIEDSCDVFEKTKLSHVIGFVQDSHFNRVEFNLARFHQVDKATGTCNNDVDAVPHCIDLTVIGHAAVHGRSAHVQSFSQWRKYVADLIGELSCWHQDHCARTEAFALLSTVVQSSEKGKTECQCLSRTGATSTQCVSTSQGIRNGCLLDGEWGGDALMRKFVHQGRGQAKVSKS
jgi:hypothetical protein